MDKLASMFNMLGLNQAAMNTSIKGAGLAPGRLHISAEDLAEKGDANNDDALSISLFAGSEEIEDGAYEYDDAELNGAFGEIEEGEYDEVAEYEEEGAEAQEAINEREFGNELEELEEQLLPELEDEELDIQEQARVEAQSRSEAAQAEIEEIQAEGDIEGNEAVTEDKLNDLNEELSELEEEELQKKQEQEELEAEKKRIEAELELAKASGDKEKIAELEGELANVNGKLASVNQDLNRINENINDKRSSIDSTSEELADQKAAKQQAQQDKLDAAKAKQADAQQTSKSIEKEALSARQDADKKAAEATKADADVAAAQAELAAAQAATKKDEDGNDIPDEEAIAAAQAKLDKAQEEADKAHAAADQADAKATDLEGKAQQAQQKVDTQQKQVDDKKAVLDETNAENNQGQAQATNNAQQANNGGGNNGGGNQGGGGGNVNAGGGGGGAQRTNSNAATKTNATNDTNVKGSTATGDSVLDDDLNFSGADPAAVSAAIDKYASSKGFDVPEGFGKELMKVCDKNDIDYGMALAICEANGFGKDGNGLMGLADGEEGKLDGDNWKNDLSDSAAKIAELRKQAGANGDDPVKFQIDGIGKQLGETGWADDVYKNYSESVSPELAKIDGVKSDYLTYIQDIMAKQQGCRVLDGRETLYDVIAKADGISKDEAKAMVRGRLDAVLERYGGADAACMSGLTMIDIAADYGVKMNYGAASTPSKLAKDIDPAVVSDCRNFVSWCLDKGHEDYLYSMNVGQLGLGYTEHGVHEKRSSDFANMKPGDIMTKGSIHAMMPIYNDPSSKTIILMESSSNDMGVQLRQLSYDKAHNLDYTFVSGETIYDGTADSYKYGRGN